MSGLPTKTPWKPKKKYTPPSKGTRRTQLPARIGKGELRRRERIVAIEQQMAEFRVVLKILLDNSGINMMHGLDKFITNEPHSEVEEE